MHSQVRSARPAGAPGPDAAGFAPRRQLCEHCLSLTAGALLGSVRCIPTLPWAAQLPAQQHSPAPHPAGTAENPPEPLRGAAHPCLFPVTLQGSPQPSPRDTETSDFSLRIQKESSQRVSMPTYHCLSTHRMSPSPSLAAAAPKGADQQHPLHTPGPSAGTGPHGRHPTPLQTCRHSAPLQRPALYPCDISSTLKKWHL